MLVTEELRKMTQSQPPVLTVYLNTLPPDYSRHPTVPSAAAWFRKAASTISRTLLRRDAKHFLREAQKVQGFLEARRPEEKALAIVAGKQSWVVVPLPSRTENEIHWGRPAIGQLFRLLSEHKRYGVVVVDHRAARFFQYIGGDFSELAEKKFDIDESQWKRGDVAHVSSDTTRKGQGPGRDLFEHRLEAQYKHLCRETAEQVITLYSRREFAGVFLVGPERLTASIAKNFAAAFRKRVFFLSEDLGGFSAATIAQRLEPVITNCELQRQRADVAHLLDANEGAIVDTDEVFSRMQDGTLRNITVTSGQDFHLRRCTKCGLVSRSSDRVCASCGGERENIELLDVLPEFAAVHATQVEFVTGEAGEMLARVGGAAGWVRQPKKAAAR
jgi:hypothetical protein